MEEREGQNNKKRRLWIPIAAVAVVTAVVGGIFGFKALHRKKLGKYDAMYEDSAILKYAVGLPTFGHYSRETNEDEYWTHEIQTDRELREYGEEKAIGPVKRFSGKLATEILSKREGQNCVFSPVNIYLALGMLAEVSAGKTREEILRLTESAYIDDMRERYGLIWNSVYQDDEEGKCLLGSSLWLRDDSKYEEYTVKRLADTYYSATFRGKMGSAKYNEALRKWLNLHTGGMLENSVSDEKFEDDVMFALVTTIWYKGRWVNQFAKATTEDGIFHAVSGDLSVPFMKRTEDDGEYYSGERFSAVKKYLENGNMLFLLPDEGVSVDDLLVDSEAIAVLTGEDEDISNWYSRVVHLSVPRFDVAGSTDLIKSLQNLGIKEAFFLGADFSPILKKNNAYIDYANHAARVKIDEEGVEGSAYTIMIASKGMPPDEEVYFTLDRPFLFCVRSDEGIPLFIGVVEKP